MHISLGGFIACPNGEMNRIKVDEVLKVRRTPSEDAFGEIFDHAGKQISEGDTIPKACTGSCIYKMFGPRMATGR